MVDLGIERRESREGILALAVGEFASAHQNQQRVGDFQGPQRRNPEDGTVANGLKESLRRRRRLSRMNPGDGNRGVGDEAFRYSRPSWMAERTSASESRGFPLVRERIRL